MMCMANAAEFIATRVSPPFDLRRDGRMQAVVDEIIGGSCRRWESDSAFRRFDSHFFVISNPFGVQ